jgi:hypothetical protein
LTCLWLGHIAMEFWGSEGCFVDLCLWFLNFGSFFIWVLYLLQIRTHSIRKAHENIDKTLKAAEIILSHFDQYRQVSFVIIMVFMLIQCNFHDLFSTK